jgi:ATP-dependent helicase HrpA
MLKACLKRMILAEKQLISRLPIISRKREIFEKLNKNNLLILEGETGSGKSTQLPQLLCEYYQVFEKEDALPVLITQPRKLATRTLAERVASEMEETVHGFVDYQTSLTSKVNEKAKIVFKMDRLVLDELKVDPQLSKYCCLVIDEAHERTISIDVILGLIKNLLTLRKDFKIIVTSASMDTELFRRYFKTEILKVSGRMYPVQEIF